MLVDCEVKFSVAGASEQDSGRCRNLSGDGILFVADRAPAVGAVLEVTVVPPEGSAVAPLLATVEVIRVDPEAADGGHLVAATVMEIKG
jgi:hypothetical protein